MMKINPKLYNLYLSNLEMNVKNTNLVNIFDCFNYNQKVEFFTRENAMYCNCCKAQLPASYCTKLYHFASNLNNCFK